MDLLSSTFQEDKIVKISVFNWIFVLISLPLTMTLDNFKTSVFNFLISMNIHKNQLAQTFTFIKEIQALIQLGVDWSLIHFSLHSFVHSFFKGILLHWDIYFLKALQFSFLKSGIFPKMKTASYRKIILGRKFKVSF